MTQMADPNFRTFIEDFDTCFNRATELFEKTPGSRILQVAGYLKDPGPADPRWLKLPAKAWIHYVVEKDGTILDPSRAQFDPGLPKEYGYQELLDSWERIYQVRPGQKIVKE